MFEFISKLIGSSSNDNNRARRNNSEFNQKKSNAINELQMLEGHKDIVRILLKISELK